MSRRVESFLRRGVPGLALGALVLSALACSTGKDTADQSPPPTVQPIVACQVAGFEKAFVVGNVLIAGQPTPLLLANARDAGYKVVINARPQSEMSFDEASLVKGLGMRYVSIPFTPDTLDDTKVNAFLDEIRKGDEKVLAHCSSGNRIAALWAMYEITDLKVPPEEAVARARTAGLKSPELIAYIGDYARRIGAW